MREADVTGVAGRAWQVRTKLRRPDEAAGLTAWIVHVPGAHPFWSNWYVAAIHLRPIDGVKPAVKNYPEAEFEFLIITLDPACEPDPDDAGEGYRFLMPPDVIEQFHGVSDADVTRIVYAAVQAICAGVLSPDSDYRSAWSRTIKATVQHFREGRHPAS